MMESFYGEIVSLSHFITGVFLECLEILRTVSQHLRVTTSGYKWESNISETAVTMITSLQSWTKC